MADRLARGVEHAHAVEFGRSHAPAAPQVAVDVDAEAVGRAAGPASISTEPGPASCRRCRRRRTGWCGAARRARPRHRASSRRREGKSIGPRDVVGRHGELGPAIVAVEGDRRRRVIARRRHETGEAHRGGRRHRGPNGLAFSPDERSSMSWPRAPSRTAPSCPTTRAATARRWPGFCADRCRSRRLARRLPRRRRRQPVVRLGMGSPELDGVRVFDASGKPRPYRPAGALRQPLLRGPIANRLFMRRAIRSTRSTSTRKALPAADTKAMRGIDRATPGGGWLPA